MRTDISKLCADFLRTSYTSRTSKKLKATHARELVAACFGYKSHAALKSEKAYPLDNLDETSILVPDIPLLDQRRKNLNELPDDLPPSQELATLISTFLSDEGCFSGATWLDNSLETYITDVLLDENIGLVFDDLSGVMAETNAAFDESPYYENTETVEKGDSLEVIVSGTLKGSQIHDMMFSGDTINLSVSVTLFRSAGKRGFLDFEIEAGGSVNDDWHNTETLYEIPISRPKEQFIEMTGGFRLGETQELFSSRQSEIHTLRNRVANGEAGVKDVDRLAHLLGTDDEDEPFGGSIFG